MNDSCTATEFNSCFKTVEATVDTNLSPSCCCCFILKASQRHILEAFFVKCGQNSLGTFANVVEINRGMWQPAETLVL